MRHRARARSRSSTAVGGTRSCRRSGRAGFEGHVSARERRGRGWRVPQTLQLVVDPHQRHRDAPHVEARDELAAQRADDLDPLGGEDVGEVAVQHEELFVLDGPQTVDDEHGARLAPFGPFGQERLEQRAGQLGRRLQRHVAHAGFAVDAEAHRHHAFGHGEQRRRCARQRASRERHPEAAGAAVGMDRDPLHRVEVGALLGGGSRDAEHAQVAGDAAPRERARRAARWRCRRSPGPCAHRLPTRAARARRRRSG